MGLRRVCDDHRPGLARTSGTSRYSFFIMVWSLDFFLDFFLGPDSTSLVSERHLCYMCE